MEIELGTMGGPQISTWHGETQSWNLQWVGRVRFLPHCIFPSYTSLSYVSSLKVWSMI